MVASVASSQYIGLGMSLRLVERVPIFHHPANVEIDDLIREILEEFTSGFEVGKYDSEFPPFPSRGDPLDVPALLHSSKNVILLDGEDEFEP